MEVLDSLLLLVLFSKSDAMDEVARSSKSHRFEKYIADRKSSACQCGNGLRTSLARLTIMADLELR